MLKIRLKRVGRKHDPSYRVVLIDSIKGPKSGKIRQILGFYDARKDLKQLNSDEIRNWVSKGAQVSDTVHNILVDQKVIEGKKINVLPQKSPVKKEQEVKAEEPQAEASNEAKTEQAPPVENTEPNKTESSETESAETARQTEEPGSQEKAETPAPTMESVGEEDQPKADSSA